MKASGEASRGCVPLPAMHQRAGFEAQALRFIRPRIVERPLRTPALALEKSSESGAPCGSARSAARLAQTGRERSPPSATSQPSAVQCMGSSSVWRPSVQKPFS